MPDLIFAPDVVGIGIALIAVSLIILSPAAGSSRGSVLALLGWTGLTWAFPLVHHPVSRLVPSLVALWLVPGWLLLEWRFAAASRRLDAIERSAVIFTLSITLWVVLALVAYRVEPSANALAAGILVALALALLGLGRRPAPMRIADEESEAPAPGPTAVPYMILLGFVAVVIAAAVGFTSQFQRYDFDASWHLVGFNKAALADPVTAANPYLGPGYSYLENYLTNPLYLAVGLTARVARAPVTWLYVCLAGWLTLLFIAGIYALVKVFSGQRWIAAVAALLAIGPWTAQMTLGWGPPMGSFYLQFLPFPGTIAQLILLPVWIAMAVRYVGEKDGESWALVAIMAIASIGTHPMGLFAVFFNMGLLVVASLWVRRTPRCRGRALAASAVIALAVGVLTYSLYHPPHKAEWLGIGVKLLPEDYLKALLKGAWILSPTRYAISPATLLAPLNLWMFGGAAFLAVWILRAPAGERRAALRWPGAAAVLAMAVGPFLLVCNPYLVPWLVGIVGPTPIARMTDQFEVFSLACQYGAVASVLWLLARWLDRSLAGRITGRVGVAAAVAAALLLPFRGPRIQSILTHMVEGQNPSILVASTDPLYTSLARLAPGIVAIEPERSELMLMTTPHFAVSSIRMTDERQRDNDTLVRFDAPADRMKTLADQYRVNYIVTRPDANEVHNGDFSAGTREWDAVVSSKIAESADGEQGSGLALTRLESDSQIAYQNIAVRAGASYRLEGFVKSGTSGDEPFAIQVFGHNASGTAPVASLEGRTTSTWTRYSEVFTAPAKELSVVLRKNSPAPGAMLFDSLSVREAESAPERFQRYPAMFREVVATADYAVFAVVR